MARKSAAPQLTDEDTQQIYVLSTGVRVTAQPVSSMRLYDASAALPFPDPPRMVIKGAGTSYVTENYSDPLFVARNEEVQRARNMRSLDVMIRSGIKLYDPMPKDEGWLEDLELDVDLSQYMDESGKVKDRHKPYLYLRYCAIVSRADFELVANAVSLSEGDVKEAEAAFRGDEE